MSEWISVDERLPEKGKPVLLFQSWIPLTTVQASDSYIKRSPITMGGVLKNSFRYYNNTDIIVEYVTHWMPLPEAPKDE